jgi:hypothetical protein
MELNIYSIYDEDAKAYLQPFFTQNHGIAIRVFSDNVNGKDNQIANHPHKFTLFHIGTYNDSTAKIDSLKTPKSLGKGNEYKESETTEMENLINEFKELIKENRPQLKEVKTA